MADLAARWGPRHEQIPAQGLKRRAQAAAVRRWSGAQGRRRAPRANRRYEDASKNQRRMSGEVQIAGQPDRAKGRRPPYDAVLRQAGYLAMAGQIVDAAMVEARRAAAHPGRQGDGQGGLGARDVVESEASADGHRRALDPQARTPPAGRRQILAADPNRARDPRLRLQEPPRHRPSTRLHPELHVTDAAAHDSRQLGRLLDPDNTASPVWADTAYRSAADVALLTRRGLVSSASDRSRAGSRCRPTSSAAMAPGRGSGSRSSMCIAAQKCRLGLVCLDPSENPVLRRLREARPRGRRVVVLAAAMRRRFARSLPVDYFWFPKWLGLSRFRCLTARRRPFLN